MLASIAIIAGAVALVAVWLVISKAGQADGICQYDNDEK